MTSKPYRGSREPYTIFHSETLKFSIIQEAKAYLKEYYGAKRPLIMYKDSNNPHKPHKVGYVYSFPNEDISHPYTDDGKPNRWYQQDWCELSEVTERSIN